MALCLLPTFHLSTITRLLLRPPSQASMRASGGPKFSQFARCMAIATPNNDQTIVRREANYHTPIWEFEYVQSLTSKYKGDAYKTRADKLKEEVRMMLNKVEDPLRKLELVDTVQRLGIYYHFEVEIKRILQSIYDDNNYSSDKGNIEDLYATALKFRLLRQYCYDVPQEVFNTYKGENGNFKEYLAEDTKGMLYLYEATYFSKRGENILDEARDFTTKHLKAYVEKYKEDCDNLLVLLVTRALKVPLHWRMPRLEARWFIDVYEKMPSVNITLLEFAKLDFNIVQAIHQEELKHLSRWWKGTRLGEKLSFARDRLMESFFWALGMIFEPQFEYCRSMFTKLTAFITIIDDVYDVYGTLEELELFTDAVVRWDINAIEQLPDYMKICFLSLYNNINEMAYDALKEQDYDIISYLKNAWAELCKLYLMEAKWYHSGYTPSLEEYMKTAWISITGPLLLVHVYFSVSSNPLANHDALESLKKYENVIRWSSEILRLSDDFGTSQDELKRGDCPKSIQCYMHETGASEEDAREHIKYMISESWKKLNEDRAGNCPFNSILVGIAMNLARTAQCLYENGTDGHGIEYCETKDLVLSSIIEPIPLLLEKNEFYYV